MADFLNGAVKGAVTVDDLRNQVTLSGFPTLDEARRSQQKELRGALEVQAQFWLRAGKIKNQPDFGKMMDASLLA